LAVREILKYPRIESVTLVDLDPEMTRLFATHPLLKELNGESLTAPKVQVINADAFPWLEQAERTWDFVVIDFPDPTNYSLGKLYTTAFYRLLFKRVSEHGLVAVQSTSPLFARQSYWCIVKTMEQAGWKTWPYHVYVPSFGEWGFVLAGKNGYDPPAEFPAGLRFLTSSTLSQLFEFPADMKRVETQPNRLNDQTLVRYYEQEWKEIAR
jgi:spermidine synthase